jgi:hypothetical protein
MGRKRRRKREKKKKKRRKERKINGKEKAIKQKIFLDFSKRRNTDWGSGKYL